MMNTLRKQGIVVVLGLLILIIASPAQLFAAHLKLKLDKAKFKTKTTFVSHEIDFALKNGDEERVKRCKIIALAQLYELIKLNYQQIIISKFSWIAATAMLERLSDTAGRFKEFSDDTTSYNYFSGQEEFYRTKARLGMEFKEIIEANKLSGVAADGLFNFLVSDTGLTIMVNGDNRYYVNALLDKVRAARIIETNSLKYLDDLQSVNQFNFKVNALITNYVKTPIDEYGSVNSYLYETLIRNSNAGVMYSVQYRNDIIKYGALIANHYAYIFAEIGLLWSDLGVSQLKKLGPLADFLLGDLLSCQELKNEANRNEFYSNSVILHQTVLSKLKAVSPIMDKLVEFEEREINEANLYGLYKEEAVGIFKITLTSQQQRTELTDYAAKMLALAKRALASSLEGKMSPIDDATKEIAVRIAKFKLTGSFKEAVETGPCGAPGLIKAYDEIRDISKSKNQEKEESDMYNVFSPGPASKEIQNLPVSIQVQKSIVEAMPAKKGEKFEIKASGTVKLGAIVGNSEPDGIEGWNSFRAISNYNIGALVVRIKASDSDGWYLCGSACVLTAVQDGIIQFAVNDSYPNDNLGSYQVLVKKIKQ